MSSSGASDGPVTRDESSIIKILLATDIHLGYAEENRILCKLRNFYLFTNTFQHDFFIF
jgi:hypothetical protein